MQRQTWSDEWKRTDPDLVVYLPQQENGFDAMNLHFLVTRTPAGAWLAIWTRAADEGQPNKSVVSSRSTDRGATWSAPIVIDGPAYRQDPNFKAPLRPTSDLNTARPGAEQDRRFAGIACWGFPIVAPDLNRIYCFYDENPGLADIRYDLCGLLRGRWSDDDGATWSKDFIDLPIRRAAGDNPDPKFPINWIVYQIPCTTTRREVIAPFSRWTSPASPIAAGSESWFLRFDNILTESDPTKLSTTTLPEGQRGLRFPVCTEPTTSWCEEPSMVELSDGRFFCVMRTNAGYIVQSTTEDRGRSWTTPAPLYYHSDGELILNPVVPAPLYKLRDGRYLLLFYNNIGDANGGHFPCNYACWRTNRWPAFISVGREQLQNGAQPIRFGPPKLILNTDGKGIGPGARSEAGCYGSLYEDAQDRILFYPDREHFLLGKRLTDDWLAECDPGA